MARSLTDNIAVLAFMLYKYGPVSDGGERSTGSGSLKAIWYKIRTLLLLAFWRVHSDGRWLRRDMAPSGSS